MWLIIGYGNILREDDGAGFHLAATLATNISPRLARILAVHQLTPELTLELAKKDVDRVLFIDARRGQDRPLLMYQLEPLATVGSCGHQLTADLLLHMTHSLYSPSLKGWLLTLSAQRMGVGDTLSEVTQSAMSLAGTMIKKLVAADFCSRKLQK